MARYPGFRKKSNKTDAILKLLTAGSNVGNPLLDEKFKDDVILPINERKPLAQKTFHPGEEIDVDIIAELAAEFLPSAIERFGCCKCDHCFADMIADVVDKCPHTLVKIRNNDDYDRAEYLKRQHRNTVLRAVVSVAIVYKSRRKHFTPKV
jgi:hypothetical protein